MVAQDYATCIQTTASTEEAYDKIARVSEWWAKGFEGSARKLGDKFTVRFGKTFVDFTIAEAFQDSKVVWEVDNCYLPFLLNKTEWNGTSVAWDIWSRNGVTAIAMTHRGLRPEVECFNTCEKGWDQHIHQSLLQFLNEGTGTPS